MNNLREKISSVDHLGLSASDGLLRKMHHMYDYGYIKSMRHTDSGVGFTGESLLNIKENNSKEPDYNGIELKFKKFTSKKITLFTQKPAGFVVKPFGINPSAKWIVDNCGYMAKDGRQKFYCSVKVGRINNRGWELKIDRATERVFLINYNKPFCWWDFSILKEHFYTKHNQTMFISADVKIDEGKESFRYEHIVYAENPSFEKFISAVGEGIIQIDPSFSTKQNGLVKNGGWPIRITSKYVPSIFEEVSEYNLPEVKNAETNQLEFIKKPISIIGEKKMHNGTQIARVNNAVNPIQESSEKIFDGSPTFAAYLVENQLNMILNIGGMPTYPKNGSAVRTAVNTIVDYTDGIEKEKGAKSWIYTINNPNALTTIRQDLKDVGNLQALAKYYKTGNKIDTSGYVSYDPANHQKNATISTMVSTTEVSDFEHAYNKIAGKLESGEVTSATALKLIKLL